MTLPGKTHLHSEVRSLTGLRGLAACWVMSDHYIRNTALGDTLGRIVGHSYIAVDLFMILSGFVLAMTYGAQLRQPSSQEVRRYIARRLARIYPLYALTTLVCWLQIQGGISGWGDPTASLGGLAANLALVQTWGWPDNSLNAAGWSISTEWAASLLFPVFVVLLLRWRIRRAALVAGAALLCLVLAALLDGQYVQDDYLTGAIDWYNFPLALLRCTTEFMLGMFCWRLRSEMAWTARLGSTPALVAVLVVIAPLTPFSSVDVLLVLLICVLVIGLSCERSIIARGFGSPVIRWLGTISFSIYLWQMPLIPLRNWLVDALSRTSLVHAEALAVAMMLGGILVVSAVSFATIEKPAQRWLNRAFARSLPRRGLASGAPALATIPAQTSGHD